jgi:ABC-type amino acid transport substrate-binding protein
MSRTKRVMVFVVIMATLLSGCAKGASQTAPKNQLDKVMEAGVIRFGISADYPPFQYVDESGEFTGFSIDVDKEIARRMGLRAEHTDVPFDTLFTALQEGKFDVAEGSHSWNKEREKIMDFCRPYFRTEDAILVREDFDTSQLTAFEDLGKFKVAEQTGGFHVPFIQALVDKGLMPQENLVLYERVDSIALDIKAGRVDACLQRDIVLERFVDELGGLRLVYLPGLPVEPMHMAVKEGETELKAAIDAVIAELEVEGWLTEAGKKYGLVR